MRVLSVFILIAVCFVGSSSSVGAKSAAEQPDTGKSKTRGPSVGRKIGSATRI